MSDSDNDELAKGIDKEQLHKLEQNDVKTDKKAKRLKRLANRDLKPEEEGSDFSSEKSDAEEGGSDAAGGKEKITMKESKSKTDPTHKPLVKTQEEMKKT